MTRNAAFLIGLLLLLLIGWGVLVGGKSFLAKEKKLANDLTQIHTQIESLSEVANQTGFWQERKAWVDSNLPPAKPDRTIRVELADLIRVAQLKPFKVSNPEFPEADGSQVSPNFKVARVRFKVTGQLHDVLPWLHGLIIKEKLLSISYLKISNGGSKEGDADFSVELKKYYAKQ